MQYEQQAEIEYGNLDSIDKLEKIIIDIENMIIKFRNNYTELKKSEWFSWKKKYEYAKKHSIDIFADLEKTLLNDIVKKISILKKLKIQIPQYQSV